MKRVICSLLALMLILSFALSVSASGSKVTSLGNGFTNIMFSNGYQGFCLDSNLDGAYKGDEFTITGTSAATSNRTGQNISQQIKIMFTQCFDLIFEPNSYGSYSINSSMSNAVAGAIYYITEDYTYVSGTQKTLVNAVNAYSGPSIPDVGYQITLENGDIITFYFAVMVPDNPAQQYFFAYYISVEHPSSHEHNFSKDWKSDEDEHWHECECGEKEDVGSHKETTINQKEPGEFEPGYTGDTVCPDCGKVLEEGQIIPPTHEHNFSKDWKSDEDEHWHECECGEKEDAGSHKETTINQKEPGEFEPGYTGDTVCPDCGKVLEEGQTIPPTHEHNFGDKWESNDEEHWHECNCGEKSDLDNHGESLINKKDPSEFEPGYTGDTVCPDCGRVLEEGQSIPPTHEHNFGDKWESNDEEHWHECGCGEKEDVGSHKETTINQKEPGEFEPGYTGDTVCPDCGKVLEEGQTIPPTHEHNFSKDWKSDEDEHWHECDCGDEKDNAKHKFNNGKCTVCGKKDPNYQSTSPSTGDNSALTLCFVLSLLSICGFAWITNYGKKNGII